VHDIYLFIISLLEWCRERWKEIGKNRERN
jgi:hypothetical protein